MSQDSIIDTKRSFTPYLSGIVAWALAFGCSVGWGSFVMPGSTFLPIAGPVGSAIGLGLGALIMGALAYMLLSMLGATMLPEGCSSWQNYIAHLEDYQGAASQPTFFAVYSAMGDTGSPLSP